MAQIVLVPRLPSSPSATSLDGYLGGYVDVAHAGVLLVLDAPNAGAHHARLWRRGPDGVAQTVRGADPIGAPGGIAVGYDVEAPLGVACAWWGVVHAADGTVLTITDEVSLTVLPPIRPSFIWIKSPTDPVLSMQVRAQSWPSSTYPSGSASSAILNSPYPVPNLASQKAAATSVVVATDDDTTRVGLERLLGVGTGLAAAPAGVLLLQAHPAHGERDIYAVVGDVTVERPGRLAQNPLRHWTIPLTQVARPATSDSPTVSPEPGAAYADSPYAHYAGVPVGLRWIDVALGWPASASSPGGTGGGGVTVARIGNQSTQAGTAVSIQMVVSGGTAPYTWSASGLPAGLTIGSAGRIKGTPTAAGSSTVTVTVTDSTGASGSATFTWVVTSVAAGVHANNPGNQSSTVGATVDLQMSASGGSGSYTWSASGLPAGLTISGSGRITGTASTAVSASPTVTATDTAGDSDTAAFSWTVAAAPVALTANNPGAQSAKVGVAVSVQLSATGGTTPYSWVATGLPAGAAISTAGKITGTPTVVGTFTATATVTDAASQTSAVTFTWTVVAVVVKVANPGAQTTDAGAVVSLALSASGGTAPYTWSASGLPAGLTIGSATGKIKGSPTTAGSYSVTATAVDVNGVSGSRTFSWTVNASAVYTPPAGSITPDITTSLPGASGANTHWNFPNVYQGV